MTEYEVVLRVRARLEEGDEFAEEFADMLQYEHPDYIEDIEVIEVEEV